MSSIAENFIENALRLVALCATLFVTACSASNDVSRSGINDPFEDFNRQIHGLNKTVDRYLFAPASDGYGTIIPQPVRRGASNFADHLSLPNDAINQVLQGKLDHAVGTTTRFIVNTVFGLAGILDVATLMDIPRDDTDFGETLHVWGAAEGPYNELPLFGPSTSRDSIGFVADIFLNPFIMVQDPSRYIGIVAYVIDSMGERYDYDATIDSILYESADSYAQSRILYLQNRRYELGITGEDIYLDPQFDPYEDPYDEF